MIDARLAALSEGGQVRQVDVASPPKRPLFPRPVWTLPGGLLLGLLGAVAWVLGRGAWSSRVRFAATRSGRRRLPRLARSAPLLARRRGGHGVVALAGQRGGSRRSPRPSRRRRRAGRGARRVLGALALPGRERTARGALRATERGRGAHDAVYVAARRSTTRGRPVLDRGRWRCRVQGSPTARARAAADTSARLGVPVLGVSSRRARRGERARRGCTRGAPGGGAGAVRGAAGAPGRGGVRSGAACCRCSGSCVGNLGPRAGAGPRPEWPCCSTTCSSAPAAGQRVALPQARRLPVDALVGARARVRGWRSGPGCGRPRSTG
jgi:hypothetical protein